MPNSTLPGIAEEQLITQLRNGFRDNKFTMPNIALTVEVMEMLSEELQLHKEVTILDFKNILIDLKAANNLLEIIKQNPQAEIINFNTGNDPFVDFIYHNLAQIRLKTLKLDVEVRKGSSTYDRILINEHLANKIAELIKSNPDITRLDLRHVRRDSSAFEILANELKTNKSIKSIDLTPHELDTDLFDGLKENKSVEEISIGQVTNEKDLEKILDLLNTNQTIKYLKYSTAINSETSRAILKILEQRQGDFEIVLEPDTKTFNMPATSSIVKAMMTLAQKIETHGDVEILDFKNVVINEEAAKELLSIIKKNPAIKVYNFNPGGDLFAKFISYNLSKISSDIIQLGVEAVGDPTGINIKLDATLATKIVELIKSNTNIKRLNLYKCTIDDAALEIIANELKTNDKIEVIDLTGNSLSDKKMGVLKNALKENTSIKQIIFNNAVLEGESLTSFLSSQQAIKTLNEATIDIVTEDLKLKEDNSVSQLTFDDKNAIRTLSLPRTAEQVRGGYLRDVTLKEANDLSIILANYQDLTAFDFSYCRFAAGAIDVIAKAVKDHGSISTIKLRDSEIDNNKLEILSPALESIKYIDLSKNRIGDTGILKRIADSNPDIVIYFHGNHTKSMHTQEEELKQIFKRRRKEELKKSLLDVTSNIAIASNCSDAKDKNVDSDELFKLIRQYLEQLDADGFSIGVESSKTPGTIEEMIAKQKQEILLDLKIESSQTKIALKDVKKNDKIERKVQIIAILQITADCLNYKNEWDRNLKQTKIDKLEKLLNTIDLSNASEDPDKQFLAQFLEKTCDIINKPNAEKTIISQTDIDSYKKDQIVKNTPLRKKFKLQFLQKKLAAQELEKNKRIENILSKLDGVMFFFMDHEMDLATPEMIIDIAGRLKNNQTVTNLNLKNLQITTEIAQALAKMLETNTCILHIDLRDCQITDREAKILADGLKKNQGLKTLKIDYNNITSAGVKYFQEALLLENQTLQHLSFGQIMGAQSPDYQEKIAQDPTFGQYCDKIEEYSIRNKLSNPSNAETVRLEKMITDERVDILVEIIEENNPNLKELSVPNVRNLTQENLDKIRAAFAGNTYLNSIVLGNQDTIIDSSVAPKQTEVEAQEPPTATVTDNTLQFGNESGTVTKLGLDQANKITQLLRDPSNKIKTLKLINCDISFESFRVIARQLLENKDIETIEFSQATKIDDQKREILTYALRESGHVITFSKDGTILKSVKKTQDAQIAAAELTEDLDESISVLQMPKLRYLKDELITSAVNLAIAANCSAAQDKLLKKDSDELFALIRGYFGKGAKDLKKYDIKITDIEPEEILKKQKDHIKGKYYSRSLDAISLSEDPLERQAQMIAAIEIITEILGRDRRFFEIDDNPTIEIQKLQKLFDLTSGASLSSSVSEQGLERDKLFLQQVFVKSLEKITQESDLKETFVTQDEADQYEDYIYKLPPEKQHDYKKFKNQFLQIKFDSQERHIVYRHLDDESETQFSYDSDDDFDEQLAFEEEVQIKRKQIDDLGYKIMYLMNDLNTRFKKTTELGSGEVGPFSEYQLQGYSHYDGEPNTDQLSIEQILEEQKKSILANQKSLAKINLSLNPVIRRAQIIAVLEIIKDIEDTDSLMRLQDRFSEAKNSSELLRQDKEFLDKVFADSFQMIEQEVSLKEIENKKLAAKTQQDKSSASQNFRMPAIARPFKRVDKEKDIAGTEEIPQPTNPNSRTRNLLSKLPNPLKTLKDMLAKREEEFSDYKKGLDTEEADTGISITINPLYTGPLSLNSSESGLKSSVIVNPLALHGTFQTQMDILKKVFERLENNKQDTNYKKLRRLLRDRFDLPEPEDSNLPEQSLVEQSLVEQLQEKISHDRVGFKKRIDAMGGTKNILRDIITMLGNNKLIDIYLGFEKTELDQQRKIRETEITRDREELDLDQEIQRIMAGAVVSPKLDTSLKSTLQKLQAFPDISIPTIKGKTFEELRKSVGGKVRINLPADLPRHLPVEFYLDGEESKLYEQINKTSELEWDKNSKTKGRDGASHPRLISFAATIDKDNQVKYRTIVTEAQGTFVHFPSQDQIKQKDDHIKQEFGKKIRDFNATGGTKSDEVTKSLEKKAIREFRQEEISKIGLKSHEILPMTDIIQTYEEEYPSWKAKLGDLTSTMPPITEDPGFCIFRPRGKNIAQVVFNLDENSDASTIDNVIYVSINGSGTKDQKPKYLRIRVGTFDGEVTETGETLKKGEVYIYPETYSKACDPNSVIADKSLSEQDKKARNNFKVLAVAVTKGPDNRKQISSSIMLDGEINKQEVQAMEKIKQSTTRDNSPTLYL